MLAIQEVRRELREIRYYYAKQKVFDKATKEIPSAVIETVSRYNQAIKNAPARLYDLYIHLYVLNNTQEALAYDWDYSNDYIKQLNKQLCEYLQSVME